MMHIAVTVMLIADEDGTVMAKPVLSGTVSGEVDTPEWRMIACVPNDDREALMSALVQADRLILAQLKAIGEADVLDRLVQSIDMWGTSGKPS